MAAFGLKHSLHDFGCKLVFYVHRVARDHGCKLVSYVHRVGRGVSIGTTCLLNVFQVITISPWNSKWAELKLINFIFPIYVTGKLSGKNATKKKDFGYCYSTWPGENTVSVLIALLLLTDVLPLGLMIWASGCMVFMRYWHKKQVQHIHRANVSLRSSPETRATQSI
ncbi:hypothetical protein HPG69_013957, partial [Diceros bicornis minor]